MPGTRKRPVHSIVFVKIYCPFLFSERVRVSIKGSEIWKPGYLETDTKIKVIEEAVTKGLKSYSIWSV